MLLAGGAASSAGGNANKVSALFGERKSSNLFNGIWRLPNSEFDRAGNFSTHMGKCTTTLLELALQLKDAQVNTFVIYFRFDGRALSNVIRKRYQTHDRLIMSLKPGCAFQKLGNLFSIHGVLRSWKKLFSNTGVKK
jgi:hypothetical protein